MIASLMGVMALLLDAQAAQSPPRPGWKLTANPGACSLERYDADSANTFLIDTTPGSDDYKIVIASQNIRKMASGSRATLAFSPSPTTLDLQITATTLPDGTKIVWVEGLAGGFLDDLSRAGSVTLTAKAGNAVSVQVPGSTKAVQALRQCIASQLIDWGADAGQFAPGGTMPVATTHRDDWLSRDELLAVMGQSKAADIDAVFRVTVSPEGVISDCHAVDDKTEQGVEKAACAATLNKRFFTAAKDPAGHPVRGISTFRIRLMSRVDVIGATTSGPLRSFRSS